MNCWTMVKGGRGVSSERTPAQHCVSEIEQQISLISLDNFLRTRISFSTNEYFDVCFSLRFSLAINYFSWRRLD